MNKGNNKKKKNVKKAPSRLPAQVPLAKGATITYSKAPTMISTGRADGSLICKHRELIQFIFGSVTHAVSIIAINPGLAVSFPWLSKIAVNFEKYIFRKLCFCYETSSPATKFGAVGMAIDYDVYDSAPTSVQEFSQMWGYVRSVVWNSFEFIADVLDLRQRGPLFVRSSTVTSDRKTYDVGQLVLMRGGQDDTVAIGELYVEYEVELICPAPKKLNEPSALVYSPDATVAAPFPSTTQITGRGVERTNDTTLTLLESVEWVITVEANGTVLLSGTNPTFSGTATITNLDVQHINTAQTSSLSFWRLVGNPGDTIILDFDPSSTTIDFIAIICASFDKDITVPT